MFGVRWIAYCVLWISILGCGKKQASKVPYFHDASFEALWLNPSSAAMDTLHTVSDFNFSSHLQKEFSQEDVDGKIYVSNFFFTACPSVCPKMTTNLKLVQEKFGNSNNFLILSHSVTPWIDSIPRLNSYAATQGITSKNWHLLTGKKEDIYGIARYSYFAEEEPGFAKDSNTFLHTEHFILVDQDQHIRGIYNGTNELETSRMMEDIDILLKEL